MWGSDTKLHKGPVTFSLMKKHQTRQTVELLVNRPLGDMSARHADSAWDVLRGYLDSLLVDEKLTAVPLLPVPTDSASESAGGDVAAGFEAASVFIKAEQSGSRGRRRRTYHHVGKLADVIDESYTDVAWCETAAHSPRPLQVERPTAVLLTVRDPATKSDSMSLSLRELSLQCLLMPSRALLTFNKTAIEGASTIYLVTRTLIVGELEMHICIRNRERVLYQAKPTPVAMKYRKIRLDRRSRVLHPRRTTVSMRLAAWVPKQTPIESRGEKEQPQEVGQEERDETVRPERLPEVPEAASLHKPAKVPVEPGSAGEPKQVTAVALVVP